MYYFKHLPLLLLPLLQQVSAQCNSCNAANSLACYSATQVQACVDGVPSGVAYDCPPNYVCTTTTAGTICQQNTTGVYVVCSNCNQCDATLTFACTGTRTFQLCLGTNTPSAIEGTCAPSHVCNTEYSYICGNEIAGILPTCSYADDSTTLPTAAPTTPTATTPTTTTPTVYCNSMQQNGRFPYGSDPNTTCRQYIYCFLLGGSWGGSLYTCPGVSYFNETSRLCGTGLPARCSTTVASLRLASISLN